ncbi:MAG: DUF488 domain-containing protein [Paludisphaera borealis]|uniref:DUF488 domain-containing protein n=1 Tax=Paludisphaera borealis TaxID=1387353 RepID=UPI00284AEBB8|nr:DUF488 domain-containing protein [Paludisphaera borealis]MDR3620018.1 DUF488 domain-containing protein [Paludisphaera borealis]
MPERREFFTIGYGGRPPEEFVGLLSAHGVKTVADVRIRPERASMGAYTKAKTSDKGIEKLLSDRGIGYRSILELGNVFLDRGDWPVIYHDLMERAGDLLVARLIDLPGPFCLLCAEKRVADCHRRIIADYLVAHLGWTVEHIK